MGENWNWSLSHLSHVTCHNNAISRVTRVPGVMLDVVPVVVSLLEGAVEGDGAAEDEDHEHHHDEEDHGPGSLR